MRYTSGTQSEREEDYVESARRDAQTILSPQFAEVHGVDVSDEMLRLGQGRLKDPQNVQLHGSTRDELRLP